eukprot:CAMPEP_0113682584 /NCGR_PEP_ID=MMETSP0038_2-20120614/12761_1 /TAXON_ID=2898 /ORGANISM="Cryptomonas paramecium" /LENGTH=279 /DNA_ID=CAMNT_0000601703 /DNA_START=68 /DNA_END=904 /DNA_ORIENTATION=- /assembly_acc=CAM_ASM_000170
MAFEHCAYESDTNSQKKTCRQAGIVHLTHKDMLSRGMHSTSLSSISCDISSQPTTDTKDDEPQKKRFKPTSSKRQQLCAADAVEIFKMRPHSSGKALKRGTLLACKLVAPKFGVSAKTIRDVWRGRTWMHVTEHLCTEEERVFRAERAQQRNEDSTGSDEDQDENRFIKQESPSEAKSKFSDRRRSHGSTEGIETHASKQTHIKESDKDLVPTQNTTAFTSTQCVPDTTPSQQTTPPSSAPWPPVGSPASASYLVTDDARSPVPDHASSLSGLTMLLTA